MAEDAAGRIYLDYNASTPVAPEVAAAMGALLEEPFGNPSSGHWAGRPAHCVVERARAQVAALLGCAPGEVVFTSGGSEANNHALKGVWFGLGKPGAHIVTTRVEHPAVLNPCRFLERLGARVTYLPVDGFGRVDPDHVRRALTSATVLVSVMHANNEVAPCSRWPKSPASRANTGCCATATPRSRWGKSPCTCGRWGWTCFRWPGTSCTPRRA